MFRKIITLTFCSCLLVACGKKGYSSPENLSTQEIIDVLTKEVGADMVNGFKLDARSYCISIAKSKQERDKCFEDNNPVLRNELMQQYNTYILNKVN